MGLLWPGFLVLLGLVPILVVGYVWALRRRRRSGMRYSSLALVRDAVPRSSGIRRHLPFALFVLAVVGLTFAIARPVAIVTVPTGQKTIILSIDVSGSMCSTDISPTRLQAAEEAAAAFIRSQSSSTQIGIVAFAGFAAVVQPPTTDQQALLDTLQQLRTGRRTAVGSGILTAIDAIAELDKSVAPSQTEDSPDPPPAAVPSGAYAPDIIVLLTDGASNAGPSPLDAAQQAADRGLRVYTIGFGTANAGSMDPTCREQFMGREPGAGQQFFGPGFGGGVGGSGFRRGIDEDTLKAVADRTDGKYFPAESAGELEAVFQALPTNLIARHEVMEISVAFAALGALLAALAILLGQAWRPLP
jgi:Ca-activated chloride channel family protein